ncbi:MAG TPA: metallophosphoesterase family protein [bacterium]|nr:metallophosphoesterase family protein [bacterium]
MRIAIISDIHGNIEALRQALDIIGELGTDEIVCLGDIVGYGPDPEPCVDLIRKHCKTVIMGNHDNAVIDMSATENFNPVAKQAVWWTHQQLSPESLSFLQGLPYRNQRQDLLFVHASPMNPAKWTYLFTINDALPEFDAFQERICFVGHTHSPRVFCNSPHATAITREFQFIINVGSVGQPRDGDARLSFGLFDTEKWDYKNIRSEYDVQTTARKTRERGLPVILAERLLRGR